MTEQPWISDPAEKEAFENDLGAALAADKPKRQVSYNQEAVLCPVCKKRIRLNNNGRLRVHMISKVGSADCPASNTEPEAHYTTKSGRVLTDTDIEALADEAEAGYEPSQLSPAVARTDIFSDPA